MERLKRFSKWLTALNVFARIQKLAKGVKPTKPINVENRRKASLVLVKLAQKDAFKEEIESLERIVNNSLINLFLSDLSIN